MTGPATDDDRLLPGADERPPWVFVLVVALAVRVGYVLLTRDYALGGDAAEYHRIGTSIASGEGFGESPVAPGGGPTAFRPPLYPLSLGFLYDVFGVHIQVVRVAQALLGTISVGLIGLLGRRLFGGRVGLVSMAVAAVYPPLVFMGAALLTEGLAVALELGAVLGALHARRSTRPWRWVALVGVLAGLGVLNRPNTALLMVPLALLMVPTWRAPAVAMRRVAVLGAVAFAVVLPWLVRDVRVMGEFVPVTTQGGLVMAGTYNETSRHDGDHRAAWRPANFVPEYAAILEANPTMGELEMEQRFRAEAMAYIRDNPTYVAEVALRNTVRLFEIGIDDAARNSSGELDLGTNEAAAWRWSYYALAVLALLGLTQVRSARGPRAVWLVPVVVTASIVVLQSTPRMRAGVEPFLILLGAAAVARAFAWARTRRPFVPAPPFVLGHRPALDGLRGVAIAVVVAHHTFVWLVPGHGDPVAGGIIGVDLFFVLSGFLITTLLLKEHRERGRVSIAGFYRRRALRLLPALWVLLLTHGALAVVLGRDLGVERDTIAGALLYVSNWLQPLGIEIAPDLSHLWSLAVEEQFYVLWPLALMLLVRRRMPVAAVIATGIAASVVLRAVLAARSTDLIPPVYLTTWTRMDGLLIGALVALGLQAGWRPHPRRTQLAAAGGVVVLAALVHRGSIVDRFMYDWGFAVAGLASAALVVAALDERSLLARMATWGPLTALGRLSYSLYLWHLLAFSLTAGVLADQPASVQIPVGLAAALAGAAACHRYVERPFLEIKDAPALAPAPKVAVTVAAGPAPTRRYRPAFASALAAMVGLVAVGSAPALAQRDDIRREEAARAEHEQASAEQGSERAATGAGSTTDPVSPPAAPGAGGAGTPDDASPAVLPPSEGGTPAPPDPGGALTPPGPVDVPAVVASVLELLAPVANPAAAADGAALEVSAVLRTVDGAPLADRTVVFDVEEATCSAVTDGDGVAVCSVAAPVPSGAGAPGAPSSITVRAHYAGDATTGPVSAELTTPVASPLRSEAVRGD